MDSFLVDRSHLSTRKVGLAVNDDADTGGGFVMRSRHSSLNPYSSLPFFSQLSPNHDGFRSQLCSFPPPSFCTDRALIPPPPRPLPLRQPPLLPLPPPSPGLKLTKTNSDTGMFRSRDRRMKLKPSVNITGKEPPPKAAAGKCREPKGERKRTTVEKVTAVNNEEGEEVAESIYSLSPPPSNLPLPSFLLSSHRDA
ncbi:hypothetical protein BHM03_00057288 [Ensete ventricosum]|nr:hypothetical protein BHM03_00057288 [Ensete ventricosum]